MVVVVIVDFMGASTTTLLLSALISIDHCKTYSNLGTENLLN